MAIKNHEETQLQNAIRVKLSECGLIVRNNVGTFLTMNGYPISIGIVGMADLTLFAKGGKTIFIEIKTPSGRLSEGQKRFRQTVTELGFEYIIIRSRKEAEELCLQLKKLNNS
ncbi:MAG: VRR-NUC domain-containing protein [Clostridia bacterium]|nr:VRR-NUC domain-containing protein [Clostridia bacterium]